MLCIQIAAAFYPSQNVPLCFTCLHNDSTDDKECTNANMTILLPDFTTDSTRTMGKILDGSIWCGNYSETQIGRYYVFYNATNSDGLTGKGQDNFEIVFNYTSTLSVIQTGVQSNQSYGTTSMENNVTGAKNIINAGLQSNGTAGQTNAHNIGQSINQTIRNTANSNYTGIINAIGQNETALQAWIASTANSNLSKILAYLDTNFTMILGNMSYSANTIIANDNANLATLITHTTNINTTLKAYLDANITKILNNLSYTQNTILSWITGNFTTSNALLLAYYDSLSGGITSNTSLLAGNLSTIRTDIAGINLDLTGICTLTDLSGINQSIANYANSMANITAEDIWQSSQNKTLNWYNGTDVWAAASRTLTVADWATLANVDTECISQPELDTDHGAGDYDAAANCATYAQLTLETINATEMNATHGVGYYNMSGTSTGASISDVQSIVSLGCINATYMNLTHGVGLYNLSGNITISCPSVNDIDLKINQSHGLGWYNWSGIIAPVLEESGGLLLGGGLLLAIFIFLDQIRKKEKVQDYKEKVDNMVKEYNENG